MNRDRLAVAVLAGAVLVAIVASVLWQPWGPPSPPPASTPMSAAGRCHYRTAADGQVLPDPSCTPGAIDPRVRQDNIQQTICTRGYTATVRPPLSFTEPLKRHEMVAYGQSVSKIAEYELDHLVPLELGGAPADESNLWVEPGKSPNMKDGVESRLRRAVCEGTIPLAEAQRRIMTDWTTALN